MSNQLDLFTKPVVIGTHLKHPIKKYQDLSINEKINAKANMTGFQAILLNPMNSIYWMRGVCYWELSDKWFWHNRVNKNSIETIVWRQKNILKQTKLNIK